MISLPVFASHTRASLVLIETIYTEIAKKFGAEESKRGMQGEMAN
jgi:hypothetical protein